MGNSNSANEFIILLAPLSGPLVPITKVPDPTFAEKMVGDGISIDPVTETLLSPCKGKVTLLHKSHHALTITTPEGIEVLIHIGLDTVNLKGKGFTPKVKEGDTVNTGDTLIVFDADFLTKNAASLLTQIVISNGEKIAEYLPSSGMAEAGKTEILKLKLIKANYVPEQKEESSSLESQDIRILNPQGLHARPTAVLTNSAKRFASDIKMLKDGREANAKSVVAIMGLDVKYQDRIRLRANGTDAAQAIESLQSLIRSGLGESLHGAPPEPKPPLQQKPDIEKSSDPNILKGVSASPGIVAGKIYRLKQDDIEIKEESEGRTKEREKFLSALNKSKIELSELQNRLRNSADVGKAAIFAAHQELLEDPDLLAATEEDMSAGKSAAFSWHQAYNAQADILRNLNNELLAGRANDILDVGRRVLVHLTGENAAKKEIPPGSILVAEDLSPSDTASLDRGRVLGFCTTGGGATSHASILARSAGIPAIAAIEERALEIKQETMAILDGDRGELRLNPTQDEIDRLNELQNKIALERKKNLEEASAPAVTADGHRVKVVANISGLAEAEESVRLGGEGVGLLRSEFLFLQRSEAPSGEEQAAVYTAIAQALGKDRDLVVRTLDVGGDKPLAYMPLPSEVNPFLGVRGIRLNMVAPELLQSQIGAILSASPYSKLHIMFPMVSTIEEIRLARKMVEQQKKELAINNEVSVGIMVEVPSAAVLAEAFAAEVDFFSIGTNDLTQYTLAIDRGHPRLAKMADGLHPAVLSLIAKTAEGAHKHGKWVGVCGGLASEKAAIPILIGLGVDELSVSVAALPQVKAEIRSLNLEDCRNLAQNALKMMSAADVRKMAAAFLENNG